MAEQDPILRVEGLRVRFAATDRPPVEILHGISFSVGRERVAIVGESGSGKTMTARAILGLVQPPGEVSADALVLDGSDLSRATPRDWAHIRGSKAGLVLQDPRFALNPLHRVGRQVEEALVLHTRLSRAERRERALDMLAAVGLDNPRQVYRLYPGELSGGMGQRVMIAAMLVNRPKLLIADEPTSALDHALRDQILALLARLADEHEMGLLLISHDLQQVANFANRVLVMRQGDIVDERLASSLASSDELYTRTLWACRPSAATYGTRLPTMDRALGRSRGAA